MEGGDAAVEAAPSEKGIFGIPQTGFFIRGSFYSCKASLYQRQAHNQAVEKRDLAIIKTSTLSYSSIYLNNA